MKTYKYWVVWEGKPPLDPRVAIRGGNSAMGGRNQPPTPPPDLPTDANERPPL